MNSILALLYCTLILSFRIPLEILAYFKSLIFKSERIPPTLSQRIMAVTSKTLIYYLPISFTRKLLGLGQIFQKRIQKRWAKKLDASFELDEWEGYLIADDVKNSEVGKDVDMIILYVHGGAFVLGNALGSLEMFIDWIKTWKLTYGTTTQIVSVEYRLSPEYTFPVARDNILACYKWLVTKKKISPSKIVFAGDSAGGNLATVSAMYLVNHPHVHSIEPPASLVLICPMLSALTNTKSFTDNVSYDCMDPEWIRRCVDEYIGDTNLLPSCSLISPVFENQLSGLPKVWACAGTYEVFLDDIRNFIERLIKNDIKAELVIEEANVHDYALRKEISRNGAYENAIRYIGKFLYGE